jgi:hypothetical protein
MRIVINVCYGGFHAPDHITKKYNRFEINRTDADLVRWVEENANNDGIAKCGRLSELMVVDIPNEATDYDILEYDGMESVICVINGKLCWLE